MNHPTRICIAVAIGLATLTLAEPAPAQRRAGPVNECTGNGCGPGSVFGRLVPNSILGCSMADACNRHDRCYSECTPCGALRDQMTAPICTSQASRDERRSKCDRSLRSEIEKLGAATCRAVGWVYFQFVSNGGDPHFRETLEIDGELRSGGALVAFIDYAAKNPGKVDMTAIEDGIRAVALLTQDQKIQLKFAVENDLGRLAISTEPPAKKLILVEGDQKVEHQRLLNGIDITEVAYKGQPLNINELPAGTLPMEALKLIQVESMIKR